MIRPLELLAPAKNLACGLAAINHGADAVYIGAPRFGARAAAGNSIADITELCSYAHQYRAKVYVTVNTIIYDTEIASTRELLAELQQAGVDAILVQDMALLAMTSLPLHASTQTDNRTADKVRWLHNLGFRRIVIARELSIDEIRAIHHDVPEVELEVFVHGALCVSYSGQCYASQHCFGRSANRGECAQVCRMQFDLLDADNRLIEHNRYLLSLKDLCQIDHLEALADAGATSFKIEGRLKDVAYVKNVTAAYSERLNQIVRCHPDRYCRASLGHCRYTFTPNLHKTFNRGYTDYFALGRQSAISSFDTPKAIGEYVGTVKELCATYFTVSGTYVFSNGDGLCFFTADRQLHGFRVNRVEGNRLYPQHMPDGLRSGLLLYRSNDQQMERLLMRPSAERKIPITLSLRPTSDGFMLTSGDVTVSLPIEHQRAEKPQRENIVRQLTKFGNTPYTCDYIELPYDFNYFIPSSQLVKLRRLLTEALQKRTSHKNVLHEKTQVRTNSPSSILSGPSGLFYQQPHLYNIANRDAARFYGVDEPTAYELRPTNDVLLMQCRHCLRYALGRCVRYGGQRPEWREPLFLRLGDGHRFRLEFDCKNCQMNVYADNDCKLESRGHS